MHPRLDRIDRAIASFMRRYGHPVERIGLGIVFVWFGMLKLAGQESATSIIAKTIYIGDPSITVPALGAWEVAIGLCFLFRITLRVAILLLLIRLPGTILALALRHEQCFHDSILLPSIQGQYLIKDATIFGAALVIGATARVRREGRGAGPSESPVAER